MRGHAAHRGVEHAVGHDVDGVSQVAQFAMEDAEDIAHAREHGQAIAEANELVVAAVWPKIVLVHDKQPGRRDRWSQADNRFAAETEGRTGLFLAHPCAETAHIHIALTARISGQVAVYKFQY